MQISEFALQARAHGWSVEMADERSGVPDVVRVRCPHLPHDYVEFITLMRTCIAPDEKMWFITADEIEHPAEFKWNQFEEMSLEASAGDAAWTAEVSAFWSRHVPVAISVVSGYSFLALRCSADGEPVIVRGDEPEFEETVIVANSFAELMARFWTEDVWSV